MKLAASGGGGNALFGPPKLDTTMSKKERFQAMKQIATVMAATRTVQVDASVTLQTVGATEDDEGHKIKITVTPSGVMRVAHKYMKTNGMRRCATAARRS